MIIITERKPGMSKKFILSIAMIVIVALSACAPAATPQPAADSASGAQLKVLATTSIVSDVVHQIGGDKIELTTLLPAGADPHSYEASPQDVAAISNASVVFANGAHLEEWLDPIIENAGAADKLVEVSDGITLRAMSAEQEAAEAAEHAEEGAAAEGEEAHEHAEGDPHTWTDPMNVIVWVQNITAALSKADPANAAVYQANAEAYTAQLKELDTWIRSEVEKIPAANRIIITDHMAFGYFAEEYGFEQVGAVIPGYSTLASPSAQELAAIEDSIKDLKVKAIFVGNTVNDSLVKRVADDTGVKMAYIYTGSLSDASGPAATYLDFIRYNVNAFVAALQ
jgi:ABC-type Zn uptake system ZnuABC Zn-binding protein ZnuA